MTLGDFDAVLCVEAVARGTAGGGEDAARGLVDAEGGGSTDFAAEGSTDFAPEGSADLATGGTCFEDDDFDLEEEDSAADLAVEDADLRDKLDTDLTDGEVTPEAFADGSFGALATVAGAALCFCCSTFLVAVCLEAIGADTARGVDESSAAGFAGGVD